MTENERKSVVASPYIKQMLRTRTRSIILLVVQIVVMLAVFIFLEQKLLPAFIAVALLRIGARVGRWNTEQIYTVDDYDLDGTYWGSYETRGTFLGGMLKLLIGAIVALYFGQIFLDKHFPADIPGFRAALTAAAFWVMAKPMLQDVLNVINTNNFLKELYGTNRPVKEILQEQEEKNASTTMMFHIVMGAIVVVAIIAQFVGLWIGGAAHKKQFANDAYDAYVEYRAVNPESPELDEAWFENALEDHEEFEKYNSVTTLVGSEKVQKGECAYELVSRLDFEYYDKAWHVEEAQRWNGEVLTVNISGTWTGVGDDLYMAYNSGDIQSIITVDSMDAEKAIGSIRGTFRGETMYYCTFVAQVAEENGLLVVSGVSDEKICGFISDVEIYFVYDPNTDVITNADHAPAIVFERN